jgi:hypothetical protein
VPKPRVKIKEKDRGYLTMMSKMGEVGAVTLGVQGEEAKQIHPSSILTVGEVAAVHELGMGVPARPFLRGWFDKHVGRLNRETARALSDFLAGKVTRNQALIKLGYSWTEQLRESIDKNEVPGPALSPATVKQKGHDTKLLDTATLRNSVTYKVWLPQLKSIRDHAQRAAARRRKLK